MRAFWTHGPAGASPPSPAARNGPGSFRLTLSLARGPQARTSDVLLSPTAAGVNYSTKSQANAGSRSDLAVAKQAPSAVRVGIPDLSDSCAVKLAENLQPQPSPCIHVYWEEYKFCSIS